jgi:hypothetical protein
MFNVSTCAKCGGSMFKLVTQEPTGSRFKINFIQCSSCNAPVGVTDFFDTNAKLEKQEEAIKKIDSRLSHIEGTLNQIANFLNNQRR